ncbi:MAG TPA: DHH family phosphoesterase [Gemmatimonadota bacterium]|nr:DHH family phosphoesterase [Gemmatimonadota bacterium]
MTADEEPGRVQAAGTERQATPAEAGVEAQRLLERLLAAVDPNLPVAIYTHDHPDPDSIASASAIEYLLSRKLGIEPIIAYGGMIGRATNRAMVDQLGVRLHPLSQIRHSEYGTHILIDTQPETGNHSLPDDLPIAIAIDHHPLRPETANVTFADVRTEYGATSTILYYYLKAAGLDLPTKLATALLIGIKSDTRGLERETSEADLHAYLEIFPRADLTLLARIESPRIPRRYFEAFHRALEVSVLHDGAIIADVGKVENPDLVAEMADFFIPLERAEYALVMGRHKGRLYLSLRTRDEAHDAGAMISRIVGELGTAGGHGRMAGGQIELRDDPHEDAQEVRRRFLSALGLDPEDKGDALIRSERAD